MKRRQHVYREAFAALLALWALVTNVLQFEPEPVELLRLQGIVVALVLLTMSISEFSHHRRAQIATERAKEVATPRS